jgi:hypothetical protein
LGDGVEAGLALALSGVGVVDQAWWAEDAHGRVESDTKADTWVGRAGRIAAVGDGVVDEGVESNNELWAHGPVEGSGRVGSKREGIISGSGHKDGDLDGGSGGVEHVSERVVDDQGIGCTVEEERAGENFIALDSDGIADVDATNSRNIEGDTTSSINNKVEI